MPQIALNQYHAPAPGSPFLIAPLVNKARAGSRIAFAQLVDLFQEDIFRMIYYRTGGSRMDAEDLTQEVFIQAFKGVSRLKRCEGFRSWLFTIAVNRVRDFNRGKRFRALFGKLDEGGEVISCETEPTATPEALKKLTRQDFWKEFTLFLDTLSHMEKEVFLLRFMDHLTISEISQVIKKNESTVKTHLYRALKKLREGSSFPQWLREEVT
jgi:RNA polymerase sigma-70 factor (ECF subfamily)